MKKSIIFWPSRYSMATILLFMLSCQKNVVNQESNRVYSDTMYKEGMQTIPGIIQCEFYDAGGEGIAYHDIDTINSGSGNLNKGNDYLSTFRINEGVDISFTKNHDSIDNSKYNLVQPMEKQLYIGWTEPGEWTKYTVNVEEEGTYQIGIMYTSNQSGQVSVETEDQRSSGAMDIKTTYHSEDPIPWRQWHHWNYMENAGEIKLDKGIQTITLHTVSKGQMNYDFLTFNLIKIFKDELQSR